MDISETTGPAEGGKKIIILCERVARDDIKVSRDSNKYIFDYCCDLRSDFMIPMAPGRVGGTSMHRMCTNNTRSRSSRRATR